jgi:hypothetical protein
MKTIAAFTKAEDAHNLRAFLEGSGITAFVRDENTVGADPLYSNAVGGVKVDVEDEDFMRASDLYATTKGPVVVQPKVHYGALRYVKLFAAVFLGAFFFLLVRGSVLWLPKMYGVPFIESVAVAILIAAFFAILRI